MAQEMDWKRMGFETYEAWQQFLDEKSKSLMVKIMANIDVFKRLKDR